MCGGPAWKREVVPDHKFDFVNVRDFTDNGVMMRLKYLWVYIVVLKSFLVYLSDIFTAITMISTDSWSNAIAASCAGLDGCITIPFDVTKWLFVGCIIFSFLLLAYESRKSKKIIASRDISYAFTNVMANNYYSIRSYDHFCFFDHISNSTSKKDDFVFFIFFTFKDWKRLILADGPRQTINALTLWGIYLSKTKQPGHWYDLSKYFPSNQKLSISALTVTTLFTVLIFAGSMLLMIAAAIFYIPLLCYIQGNLKEYVCHKVDKRISQIIKRRNKERLAKASELARKEAMGDYSHLKNKKGELIAQPLPQPTLPNLSVDDDFDDSSTMRTRVPPSSTYTQDKYYASSEYKSELDYPPMPAYSQTYGQYSNPSQTTFADDMYQSQAGAYDDDTAHLTRTAAPFSQHSASDRLGVTREPSPPHNFYDTNSQDAYQGIEADRRTPAPQVNAGAAYWGAPPYSVDYPAPTTQIRQTPQQSRDDAYGQGAYYRQGGAEHSHRGQGGGSRYS